MRKHGHRLFAAIFLNLLILIPSASAREVRFEKKVDAGALQAQLVADGFKINWIECSTNRCKIVMPDSEIKNPLPLVTKYKYIDPAEARRKKTVALQALYAKWQDGTITATEKDTLIREAIGMLIGR